MDQTGLGIFMMTSSFFFCILIQTVYITLWKVLSLLLRLWSWLHAFGFDLMLANAETSTRNILAAVRLSVVPQFQPDGD